MRAPLMLFAVLTLWAQPVAGQDGAALPVVRSALIAELPGVRVSIEQVAVSPDGRRIYYSRTAPDELWLHDVPSGRSTRVMSGPAFDLTLSPGRDRVAFLRRDERSGTPHVWTLPLDPVTGLAAGNPWRVSLSAGAELFPGYSMAYPAFSADGRWIAFHAAGVVADYALVVVPSVGGAERVLVPELTATHLRRRWPRWSADAAWFYYFGDGMRRRVPFDGMHQWPSWSPDGGWIHYLGGGTMRRVPFAGGDAEVTGVPGWGAGPSPDGRLVAFEAPVPGHPFRTRTVLANSFGDPIADLPWAPRWASPTLLMWTDSYQRRALRSISLSDGVVRDLLPDDDNVVAPAWAPDGTRFAALSFRGVRRDLVIANADGSGLRRIHLVDSQAGQYLLVWKVRWSPDGRWIAVNTREGMFVVDAESGGARPLELAVPEATDFVWTSDSQRLRYVGTPWWDPEPPVRTPVRELSLGGADVLIDEVTRASERGSLGNLGSWAVSFISDTTLLVVDDPLAYVHSLTTGARQVLYTAGTAAPSASPSGRLFVMRPAGGLPGDGDRHMVDIVTATGEQFARIGFGAQVGVGNAHRFIFTPDEKSLISSGIIEPRVCCSIYRSTIQGGVAEKLLDLPAQDRIQGTQSGLIPQLDLSPDGRTLLFTSGGAVVTRVYGVDVSALVPPPAGRR